MTNLYEEHAREKIAMPADWRMYRIEALPSGGPYEYISLHGAVCPATFTKGKRKGQTKWSERIKQTDRQVVFSIAEHDEWVSKLEERTGKCAKCVGTKQEFAGWSATDGTRYRPCHACKATGVPLRLQTQEAA